MYTILKRKDFSVVLKEVTEEQFNKYIVEQHGEVVYELVIADLCLKYNVIEKIAKEIFQEEIKMEYDTELERWKHLLYRVISTLPS